VAQSNVVTLEGVDLSDLGQFADGPPYELFARMRAEAPVHWNPLPDEPGFWSLTRFRDIAAVSRDHETFSSARGGVFLRTERGPVPLEMLQGVILGQDPPLHDRVRGTVQRVFVPRMVAQREAGIAERVDGLIDSVIEKGSCDFVKDIAVELPLQVIAEMLGVPQEDRFLLFELTNQLSLAAALGDPTMGEQAIMALGFYMAEMVGERRESPGDDLLSRILTADVDGERLSDEEVVPFCALLMFAGNDTTRNTASGAVRALLENPDQRRRLAADPSLIPGAVEEFLRWVTPVIHFRRTATRDTEIGGQRIAEGDKVTMWYSSGSRDEDVISDAPRFDVTRTAVEHQAFGGGGKHFCLGAQLARMELRILFTKLLERIPEMELAGEVTRLTSNFSNELTSLPIVFPAGRRSGS
jgi:linalool 8-monooxygenase